jgi:hypothetical protein
MTQRNNAYKAQATPVIFSLDKIVFGQGGVPSTSVTPNLMCGRKRLYAMNISGATFIPDYRERKQSCGSRSQLA